ncbi:hypothetical protein EAH77_03200 [Ewingella americana]|uniref:Uncharacterized protein n=1 Tax=Ewingella americana TaxID=41202 RepID=A0A502GSD6_9GAMM|nr:hypothetical protein EAH77_03200 [Ewingella americana]
MLSLHRLAGDILNTAGASLNSKPKPNTISVFVFKKVRAAFKNGAEQVIRDLRLETRSEGTA